MINENISVARLSSFLRQRNFNVETTYVLSAKTKFEDIKLNEDCKLFGLTIYPENLEYVIQLCKYIKNKIDDAVVFVGRCV